MFTSSFPTGEFRLSAPKLLHRSSGIFSIITGVIIECLGRLMVFFAAQLALLAGKSIDSAVVCLFTSYALNISNNDFVVHDMFIIQLVKLSSSLPV